MSGSIEGRRRRSARDPLRRVAEYAIADTDGTWRPCRLIDVSLMGVGLDLLGVAPPAAAVGDQVTLRLLNAEGQPNGILFSGEIRDIGAGQEILRVGVEFVDLDVTERAALEIFLQRHFV